MIKNISSGKAVMDKIKEGVDLVANPVKSTISPNGRTVIISESYVSDYDTRNRPILVSKDGYKVSTKISSNDPDIQVGVLFAQQAAEKQMIDAGDATSTCTLFVQSFLESGLELIESGKSHVAVKELINDGVESVVNQLKKMAIPVNGDVEIKKIATVSANNDSEIGDLIGGAYEKIGDSGMIKIEKSKGVNTTIKITGGITFGRGWASEHFINAPKGECALANPYILVVDEHLVKFKDIETSLGVILAENRQKGENRPLMIFCNRTDGEALATLIYNHKLNGRNSNEGISSCVVQMEFLDNKKVEFMNDIALATGAKFISENTGGSLEKITIDQFGSAESVTVSKDETTIVGGKKDEMEFDKEVVDLKKLEHDEIDPELKDLLQKRIARLTSSVAIISVGGTTEVEMEERLDRVDDAVRASKCAIEEGYLPGGGTSFLRVLVENNYVLGKAMLMPISQICNNGGKDYDDIFKEVSFADNKNIGYNAKEDRVEDLVKAGIIEPLKSNRCALQNAASVVNQILSSQYVITDSL
jgi:chaperonin GroEL